jgi:hypothetical protein
MCTGKSFLYYEDAKVAAATELAPFMEAVRELSNSIVSLTRQLSRPCHPDDEKRIARVEAAVERVKEEMPL